MARPPAVATRPAAAAAAANPPSTRRKARCHSCRGSARLRPLSRRIRLKRRRPRSSNNVCLVRGLIVLRLPGLSEPSLSLLVMWRPICLSLYSSPHAFFTCHSRCPDVHPLFPSGLRVRMGVATGSISGGRPVMTSTVMSLAKGGMGQQALDGKLKGGEPDPAAALGFSRNADCIMLSYHIHKFEFKRQVIAARGHLGICMPPAGRCSHVSPVPLSRHPQPPAPSSSAPHSCL